MARTAITAQTLTSPYYPVLPLGAGTADLTETAVDDPTDRQTTLIDGKTVILAHNTDVGAHTITFTSVADSFNRTGDITAYSIAAGKIARFGPFKSSGWATSGQLLIDVSDPLVRLAVVTLP
jgi:hypothetical protein